ncbi:MAG TPA: haloalkane dehalogenase [Solirubrobacterales bacterium]|nr:haloalkane dehalogenase [Solirubrobacterales bacterium]
MTDTYRTPDDRFEGLPGFPWEPKYIDWEGIRLARIDEGDGDPIVLFHGEPTWSFLYRKVMPPLLEAGHRCIAPDYAGFGRSDKPTDFDWYTYDNHTASMIFLLDELAIQGATFVVQDWGGPIGMRVAAERPDLCARLVVMDTGVFTGHQPMSDAWKTFRDFVERTEDLPISMLVGGACKTPPSDEVLAGYDAPFPAVEAKQGARAFPLILPTTPDAPGGEAGQRTLEAMASSDRPALVLWADSDPVLTLDVGHRLAERIGWPEPEVIEGASHFLQEDQGERIGRRIAAWLAE